MTHQRPDILVLGGGGRQGDAWMTGLLAGIEDAHGFDLRDCEYFVGTSAGSIVAAKLAGGRLLRRPATAGAATHPSDAASEFAADSAGPAPLARAAGAALALTAPLARLGLHLGTAPGELVRRSALGAVPVSASETLDFRGSFSEDAGRFDGRLRIVALDRRAGSRVVFGAPGAPEATVEQALTASCALPLVFPPAVIAGREYVDGALWSPTNADVAPAARGAQILVLAPMASLHGPFNAAVRCGSRAAMLVETSALRSRGARVRTISPDPDSASAIGPSLMATAELERTRAAGYAQGLRLSPRLGQT